MPDISGILERLKNWSQQFKSFSTNVFIVGEDLLRACTGCFVDTFVIPVISEKRNSVAKVLLAILEIFLLENNRNYDPYGFSYKRAFILFFSFLTNQKEESGFQQVGGLVTRIISVFCLQRVALYFKAMPNSIDFYKGIFLLLIPVRFIVPWFDWLRSVIQTFRIRPLWLKAVNYFCKSLNLRYLTGIWIRLCRCFPYYYWLFVFFSGACVCFFNPKHSNSILKNSP